MYSVDITCVIFSDNGGEYAMPAVH